jgi:hypothetical protein
MLGMTRHDNPASMTDPIETNRAGRTSLLGPAAFAAALALAAVIWLASPGGVGGNWPEVLAAAAFVLTAGLGVVWHGQARAARRFNAVLDAYAGQEIVRARRWKELARTRRAMLGK